MNLTNQDANSLETLVKAKHLRFSMVRTAIALGLTLINLAKVEYTMGNFGPAESAVGSAKQVHEKLRQCLAMIELNPEEKRWAAANLHELGQAIGLQVS